MAKGLPKKYAKMGFKKGWKEYRKVHPKKAKTSKKSTSKKSTTKNKKRGKTMAKKKNNKKKSFSATGLIRGGIYALTFGHPLIDGVASSLKVPNEAGRIMTDSVKLYGLIDGNGKFRPDYFTKIYGPLIAWSAIDWGLSKVGVWKKMGQLLKF